MTIGQRTFLKSFFLLIIVCWLSQNSSPQGSSSTSIVKVKVSEGTNMAIAVSPDGKTIALDIQGTIHTLAVTGGTAKALTDGLGDERQPCWSPDGSRIAFQSYRDGTYHIWTINKNGSGLKNKLHLDIMMSASHNGRLMENVLFFPQTGLAIMISGSVILPVVH